MNRFLIIAAMCLVGSVIGLRRHFRTGNPYEIWLSITASAMGAGLLAFVALGQRWVLLVTVAVCAPLVVLWSVLRHHWQSRKKDLVSPGAGRGWLLRVALAEILLGVAVMALGGVRSGAGWVFIVHGAILALSARKNPAEPTASQ